MKESYVKGLANHFRTHQPISSFRFGGDFLNPQLNHFQPQGGAFQTVRGSFGFSGSGAEST